MSETAQPDTCFTIRKGMLTDLDTISAFNMAMAKETENLELPEATARAGVLAVLDGRASHAAYFLLEEREQVVAQLMITLEWSDWRAADIWWIQSVYVKPECRRRGHFRALYAHVRGECRRAGACGLRLYADNGNERAHAAYEGLGMTSHYKVFEDMFTEY